MNPYRMFSGIGEKFTFVYLIRALNPDLIMDVGSRDGSDALRFKTFVPDAKVIAIEANPDLHAAMAENASLSEADIESLNCAVSNSEGEATFSIYNQKKGTGSLRKRSNRDDLKSVTVQTRRLDNIVAPGSYRRIALWIDIEGNSYEAIEGADRILDSVIVAHAEVESTEMFEEQVTEKKFRQLMRNRGFIEVEGGIKSGRTNGNIIFVAADTAKSPLMFTRLMGYKIYAHLAKWAHNIKNSGKSG